VNYQECISFLYNSLPVFHRIGAAAYKNNLDNTYALLEAIGNPHKKLRAIHVAGTNGKGSVSHNLASILMETGYKTGLYTSPHLKDFRERIQINGNFISSKFVVNFVKKYRTIIAKIQPSFFEMTVAMAFLYFAKNEVDIAVIEVGMGGRLDSTNVVFPILSIITNISFDHTQFLGDSLEKIATEKAGIIKPQTSVVIGEKQPQTQAVFQSITKEKNAPLFYAADMCKINTWQRNENGVNFSFNGSENIFFSPLSADYQRNNFITVKAACTLLDAFLPMPLNIAAGFANCVKNTHLHGRWEVLQQNPLCIADTGHNEAGIAFVCQQLSQMPYKKLHFVLGVVEDKDLSHILPLLPTKATYYFCKADIPRGLAADILAKKAAEFGLFGNVYSSVKEAFMAAKNIAHKEDLVFVGGSTFTVAEVV
jgi:dihydrofolate synthase/folylpolyglutamate synthase